MRSNQNKQWMEQLECDARGTILCTASNMAVIVRNDENLQNLRFNEMRGCIDVTGSTPWDRNRDGWGQADFACIQLYMEEQYAIYSPSKCRDALTAVLSSERRFHPVKTYLEDLTWDGKVRLEQMLVDYLGAEDTSYVRTVTRKTFAGAVARIYEPGIKMDSMLVLCGPQGIGKSTLFSRMGGKWYSDSMAIADMRDKTAAEKLQGIWIMELSELAGLKKVDVETVKSFLSRTDDQYRMPYGTFVEAHPRKSILVATTNTTNGFLRDITGNRRFWPVLVNGKGKRKAWELAEPEIGQLWAEAYALYKSCEPLYLTDEIEDVAKDEQRKAMEDDPRRGLIEEYLTNEKKERICLMELWCECLGHERQDMRKADAYELEAMLQQMGGWEAYNGNMTGKMRHPGYGVQRTFVRRHRM